MISVPSGMRVWLAVGHTDVRRGMSGLALQVREAMKRDSHAGDLYVFRGRRGNLVKLLWHDGLGMSPLRQAVGARQVHLALAGERGDQHFRGLHGLVILEGRHLALRDAPVYDRCKTEVVGGSDAERAFGF